MKRPALEVEATGEAMVGNHVLNKERALDLGHRGNKNGPPDYRIELA